MTLYGDRLGVFVRNDAHWTLEEELQGAQHPTHFGQVLRDLGIGYIAAHSPRPRAASNASGKPSRTASSPSSASTASTTVEAAEAFLPTYLADHNRRFAQPPPTTTAAWRRPPRDLADRLSCRYTRRVARDNTVRLGPRLVQIPRGPHGRSYAGCRVEVRECLDGRLLVDYQGRRLATAPAPAADFVLVPRRAQRLRASRSSSEEGGRHLPLRQNRARRRAPRSPPWPSICAVPRARIPGGRPSRAGNANANARTPSPPDGRTFSLNS